MPRDRPGVVDPQVLKGNKVRRVLKELLVNQVFQASPVPLVCQGSPAFRAQRALMAR